MSIADGETGTVQKRPEGAIPGSKSWTCSPLPAAKRSIQMKPKPPSRTPPFWPTYLPLHHPHVCIEGERAPTAGGVALDLRRGDEAAEVGDRGDIEAESGRED